MITILCNQCRATLEIDDAFAGGVCRCQYCGTIQTVPSHLKPTAAAPTQSAAAASSAPAATKTLYQNKAHAAAAAAAATSPSGLEELAQVVASSGLSNSGLTNSGLTNSGLTNSGLSSGGFSGSGLRTSRLSAAAAPVLASAAPAVASAEAGATPVAAKILSLPMLLMGGGALAAVAVTAVVLTLVIHGHAASSGPGDADNSALTASTSANFCGVGIAGNNVVYLLDRASSIHDQFDPLKAATYGSIHSLGPERKFAVLLWNNGGDDILFPPEGLRFATSDQVELLKASPMGSEIAAGASQLRGSLEMAMGRKPDAIVIVTAKADLSVDDAAALDAAAQSAAGKVRFYGVVVGGPVNDQLKKVAESSGGAYRNISDAEIRLATP